MAEDKKKNLTYDEKQLIKKYEAPKSRSPFDANKKKMYQEQTDKNYKDGDRN